MDSATRDLPDIRGERGLGDKYMERNYNKI